MNLIHYNPNAFNLSCLHKKQLWKQIIVAKIRNQSQLLEKQSKGSGLLQRYYSNVKSGDSTNREGVAAKAYWKHLLGKDFIRDRYGVSPNNLLNYGYALLRAYVARFLMNAGLLPTVGIFHRNAYNAFPLADDVMEPYRPFVDLRVMQLFEEGCTDIDKNVKKFLIESLYKDITPMQLQMTCTTLVNVYENNGGIIVYPEIK